MSTQAAPTGPLGHPRGILFAIVLAIVTLGIYSLSWVSKTQEEVKAYSGNGIGGVLGLVIYILLSPVTWFVVPSEVGKMYQADGRTAPFTGWTGLWLLLPLVVRSSGSSRCRAECTFPLLRLVYCWPAESLVTTVCTSRSAWASPQ